MTQPLILLFVGIGITVLIGVLVVAVMVRTRRPGGGVREWIRESADSWQENEHRAPGNSLVSGYASTLCYKRHLREIPLIRWQR